MVAKITIPKSIRAALNYNEKKVQQGVAVCLHAANYLREANEMNFYQKLAGFEKNNRLNDRATTKTIHVSLNFAPAEHHAKEKLIAIANRYMEKIGFGEQPFIVYQHHDAGHPHIHIVSTTIKKDGSRINTHNIGKNKSEPARKEIEHEYRLMKAEKQNVLQSDNLDVKPVTVIYGQLPTKRSISNVVTNVFNQYKFTSLPEYNAALRQFNIVADRGNENSRVFKHKGLLYRVLDDAGNKLGVPIKSSSIGCKPTLHNLEQKFKINEISKQELRPFLRAKLDLAMAQPYQSVKQLERMLEEKSIYARFHQNAEGRLYGVTFVDNQNKVVFNGSDLGKGYSMAALQSRITTCGQTLMINTARTDALIPSPHLHQRVSLAMPSVSTMSVAPKTETPIEALLAADQRNDSAGNGLLNKKRKKKKKNTDFKN